MVGNSWFSKVKSKKNFIGESYVFFFFFKKKVSISVTGDFQDQTSWNKYIFIGKCFDQ